MCRHGVRCHRKSPRFYGTDQDALLQKMSQPAPAPKMDHLLITHFSAGGNEFYSAIS